MANYCQLWLTCKDNAEADKIAKALLNLHLVACVKQLPVNSDYWWKNNIEHDNEILLVMDSKLDYFENIETEITKIHSYETFNLQAVAVAKVSTDAEKWLNKELKD